MPLIDLNHPYPKPISRQADSELDRQRYFDTKREDFLRWRKANEKYIDTDKQDLIDDLLRRYDVAPGPVLDLLAVLASLIKEQYIDHDQTPY